MKTWSLASGKSSCAWVALKFGHSTSSLLLSKLQTGSRQNAVARGLLEYGRLVRTLFILRYLAGPELQLRVHRQLKRARVTCNDCLRQRGQSRDVIRDTRDCVGSKLEGETPIDDRS